jgi:hypothetical protein
MGSSLSLILICLLCFSTQEAVSHLFRLGSAESSSRIARGRPSVCGKRTQPTTGTADRADLSEQYATPKFLRQPCACICRSCETLQGHVSNVHQPGIRFFRTSPRASRSKTRADRMKEQSPPDRTAVDVSTL